MITFFKKLFKRGDFMTRADKWYYSKVIKTWLWSAFAFVIIAWVGTNLVLCALSTNVKSGGDIIYEVPRKDVILPTGNEFRWNLSSDYSYDGNQIDGIIETITFDYYSSDGVYTGGGSKNLIANVTPEHVVDGVDLYRTNSGKDIYVLSKDNMVANTDCHFMFYDLGLLKELNLNNFNTSYVENMYAMFSFSFGKYRPELDLSNWDVSNVTNMNSMFECGGLSKLDISNWDTSKVTDMSYMFHWHNTLTTIYVSESFVTTNVKDSEWMFMDSDNLKGGAGTTYDENHIDAEYARIDGGPNSATPGYFTKKA